MILSVHIADVGPLASLRVMRRRPEAAGLRYAELVRGAPLGRRPPLPQPGRVGLIAAWDDDRALDGFLASHPLAERLAGGWHVRLAPLRAVGEWPGLPGLAEDEQPVDDDEPVAVLTLGRPIVRRLRPFLKASLMAERQAVGDDSVLAMTGLARPPRLVATFSLWRTAAEMRAYAHGRSGPDHLAATRAHNARPFHRESLFARFRPYAAQGAWDGRDPLAQAG
jgi:hypothetical protein